MRRCKQQLAVSPTDVDNFKVTYRSSKYKNYKIRGEEEIGEGVAEGGEQDTL